MDISLNSGTGIKDMYPFQVTFILAAIPSICESLPEDTCNVVPKDPYIEAGSDTEIACQTSCVHGNIFWTLDNRPVDDSLSKTINSSHTVLSLRNVTRRTATLQCHSADTQLVLGGTTIRTYTKPTKVSCVLHYENETTEGFPDLFTCKWEHRTDSSLEITYTVLCSCSSCPSQSEICSSRETTCTSNYDDVDDQILFGTYYNVSVRARSAAWEAVSDRFEFTPLKILKITRPELSVTTNSDHMLVSWKIRSRVSVYQYRCQVKYDKAVSEGTLEVLNKWEMTIENVESCSNYTFAVRCALDDAPWSDWSHEKTILTKLKKSDFKPRLWRKITEAEKNGVRKVHAMWSEIPPGCQEAFTFTIKQSPYKENTTGGSSAASLCGNSACDVNQEGHRMTLTVFQNESVFVEDSVYVPATGESLPQVTDIQTSVVEGVILVSWEAPEQKVSGYIIDYTHNGNQFYWKETNYTNATLSGLLDKRPYNITVTPLFGDKTGHGAQAPQICSRVGEPGNVTITKVQPSDKSALVRWDVKSQEACSGVVVNYTLFYGAPKGPQLNVTVDGTTRDALLKDLDPETQYGVYVKATSLTGTTESQQRFFQTKRFDPRLSKVLKISGGVLIASVLSLGLCCAFQYKKFREKPVPNPRHSSVALWLSTTNEKGICPFQPFHNPSESLCDKVHTEKPQTASTSPLVTGCKDNPASNHTGDNSDPSIAPASDAQSEDAAEHAKIQDPSSPGESTKLLSSADSLSTPYRSQSPVETPAQTPTKQYNSAPVTPQETVYVTLDMFEQSQSR